jgi:putative DNA primase/helicase
MHVINVSPAVVFRVIEAHKPTLIIDEGDTFLKDNEDMRGLLNGGHDRRTAYVWRSVGETHEPRQFNVWAPKVVAMIGRPSDTLVDRSLMVHLRRKRPGEALERFSVRKGDALRPFARRAARWVRDNQIRLANADPAVPEELHDRAQDNARALCAIADAVGGDWPRVLRQSMVGSAKLEEEEEPQSDGILLLTYIREIVARWKGTGIGSTDLRKELIADDESPWTEWRRGDPITLRGIAYILKPFGIRPQRDRNSRFYRIADFDEAFDRYLEQPTD